MDALKKRAENLRAAVAEAAEKAGLAGLQGQLEELSRQMNEPDFWNDPRRAGAVSKEQAALEQRVQPLEALQRGADEALELISLNDSSLTDELNAQLDRLESEYEALKKELRYDGPYDHGNAILNIYAGAGGTDAQDWAQMLFRMYVRWAEKNDYKAAVIDESTGEEAGIKSVTFEVSGNLAYGKLKGEDGVHRLVRLSPFNADSLRQTSFAKVEVLPMIDRPDDVQIEDKDLKIDVYRSGGHGGQSVNTTDSAVRITHLPTGITVAIQNERSQLQNKEAALTILRSKLMQLQIEQHAEKLSELKGENEQAAWGNQIRNYVLHPYKLVKDLRSGVETSSVDTVLDGDIDLFIQSF